MQAATLPPLRCADDEKVEEDAEEGRGAAQAHAAEAFAASGLLEELTVRSAAVGVWMCVRESVCARVVWQKSSSSNVC